MRHSPRSVWIALRLLLTLAAASPCLAAQQAPSPPGGRAPDYVIGPQDVLDIAVWDNEQISRTVPVRPDGKISLPLLDDVPAAGLTPIQLRDFLKTALAPYIPVPTVSVIVQEVHSFKVTVIGEVKTPDRYEVQGRSTVLDVLAMAGGLTEYAARNRIVVIRRQGTGTREIPFDFDKLVARSGHLRDWARSLASTDLAPPRKGSKGSDAQHNFDVEPGDIILVP